MASGEVSHHSEVERFLLPNVDAQRVLEILLAPPSELHDDRVLWRGHGESESTPGNLSLRLERLSMRCGGCGNKVDPRGRPRVLYRHMTPFNQDVVEVLDGGEERGPLESRNDLRDLFHVDRCDDVNIRDRARHAECENGNAPDEHVVQRLARKTSSAILRTSSRLRLFCGMTQAPSEFDELESHLQRLARSKPARPNRRNGKVAEPFFLAASLLPGSLHVGASPHAVLDDSSVRHEAILGTSDGPARTASETICI